MVDGQEVWLVIPAKKDNQGVPGKNRLTIAGRPILSYTLDDAKQCNAIDRIFLATNDEGLTKQFPSIPNIPVPPEYFDKTPSTLTVRKAVLSSGLPEPGFVIEAYASTPVRPPGAFAKLLDTLKAHPDAGSAWPLEETQEHPYRLVLLNDGLIPSYRHTVARQDYPQAYKVVGCAWAYRWAVLKSGREDDIDSLYGAMAGVPIPHGTIEIDTMEDLAAVNKRLSATFLKVG